MCGIAGILDQTAATPEQQLRTMAAAMGDALRHRGPDDDGVWVDEASGIGLAHRRLAVIAPTPEGRQPARSRCGRHIVVYNGEIYNFRELADMLAADGHRIDTNSDTVVLAEALAQWGVARTASSLVGMFAFAVFDRETRDLTLVRDRVGIKPLYWAQQGRRFAFGSELKAILASDFIETSRDPDAMAAYLQYAYVPAPATIYREVRKLMPGTMLTIGQDGAPSTETYWSLADVARTGQADPVTLDDPMVAEAFETTLKRAVADRMISDVPLGAWLSGGLDSSTVVALMQEQSATKVKTYSIGFDAPGYDEAADARLIARHLGTDHHELRVTPEDAIDAIDAMPLHYDEPFADSSQIPTYLLSRLTRAHVTVALSGDGGDEVFAGYNRYWALPRIQKRFSFMPGFARRGMAATARALSPQSWDRLARRMPGRMPPQFGDKLWKLADAITASDAEAAYGTTISQWPAPHGMVHGASARDSGFAFDRALEDPVAKLQFADSMAYLPDDILTKVDRASMAHALEVRVPLLDHRLVEFAWRLPRSELLVRGQTKLPLRQALARRVPAELFERPKSGFAIPVGAWLRGPLRDWAESLLSETALKESALLHASPIRSVWQDHLSGRSNHEGRLWAVLMFQLWDRANAR